MTGLGYGCAMTVRGEQWLSVARMIVAARNLTLDRGTSGLATIEAKQKKKKKWRTKTKNTRREQYCGYEILILQTLADSSCYPSVFDIYFLQASAFNHLQLLRKHER